MGQVKDICVVIEWAGTEVKSVSLEAINAARKLSGGTGGKVVAVVLSDQAEGWEDRLAKCGADEIRVFIHSSLGVFNSFTYRKVLESVLDTLEPLAVITGATNHGKELIPALAARFHSGCLTDCNFVDYEDSSIIVQRPAFSGKAISKVRFTGAPPFFITVRPNIFRGDVEESGSPEFQSESLDLPDIPSKLKLVDTKMEEGRRDITEARIVVSGGMGMQGPENFQMLEALADTFDGAVGASRPVVDEGWRPYSNQVGQTGRTISPSLYIACGISGAVQHLAGMSSSPCIVAINKDPDAPIFDVADFGIVGDALEVVPELTRQIQKITNP